MISTVHSGRLQIEGLSTVKIANVDDDLGFAGNAVAHHPNRMQ